MIVNQKQAPLADFMWTRTRLTASEDFRAIALVPDRYRDVPMLPEHIVSCIAYQNFVGRTCAMIATVPQPQAMTRDFYRAMFAYPFLECGVTTIITCVESTNAPSLNICERVGFKRVLTIPDGGLDEDLIVFTMRRDACRFLAPAVRRVAA